MNVFVRIFSGVSIVFVLLVFLASCTQSNTNKQAEEPQKNTQQPSLQLQPAHLTSKTELQTTPSGSPAIIALESKLVDPQSKIRLAKGEKAPDFEYLLADGTVQKLSDFRGKKVMINFWATWCPPCNAEMPDIQQAAEQFTNQGFVVLGVSQDAEARLIEPFARKYHITFPLIADADFEIGSRYSASSLPSSYFINTDGTINAMRRGTVNVDSIRKQLEEMN